MNKILDTKGAIKQETTITIIEIKGIGIIEIKGEEEEGVDEEIFEIMVREKIDTIETSNMQIIIEVIEENGKRGEKKTGLMGEEIGEEIEEKIMNTYQEIIERTTRIMRKIETGIINIKDKIGDNRIIIMQDKWLEASKDKSWLMKQQLKMHRLNQK